MDQTPVLEQLCIAFDMHLDFLFELYQNTNVDFVKTAMEELVKVVDLYPAVKVADVLNNTMYDWYYGNFLTKLLALIFQPYLYSKPCFIGDYSKRMSGSQIRYAYRLAYKLVTEQQCVSDQSDYYGETPTSYIQRCDRELGDLLPADIRAWIPSFAYLFKHGKDIVHRQQAFIRTWHRHWMAKRKHAVDIIQSWWLEIILNPDTRIGKKKFHALEHRFNKLAESQRS